jgi:dienelactone hydrolase
MCQRSKDLLPAAAHRRAALTGGRRRGKDADMASAPDLRRVASTAHDAGERLVGIARHPLWAEVTAPLRIPVAWYVRAWFRRLRPNSDRATPHTPPSLSLALQAAIDETVLAVVRLTHRIPPPEEMERVERDATEAVEMFRARGWLDDPASYHETPPPLTDVHLRKARSGAIRYTVMSFESGYEPHPGEPGREQWLADVENRTAYVWMLRHDEPRPWIVCVHGAAMGQAAADLRVFRAAWLHTVLGLNVALPIQPRHGPRRAGLPIGVGFPNQNLMDNVHAVTQSVWDIRRLMRWIRETQDSTRIGVQGLSLGGYTVALLAGIEHDISCVILGVPAVDFAALMAQHAPRRFRSDPRLDRLTALAQEVDRVISPLAIQPKVPYDRRFIYAGLADRLVHPLHQVQALWSHWDEPDIKWFSGGHVGFFVSRPVREFLERALRSSGMLAEEEPTSDAVPPSTQTAG